MSTDDWVELRSSAGKTPKLDEDLKRRIKKLSDPTHDEVSEAIQEYRAEKAQRALVTLEEEDEIYRFTI